MTNIYDMSVVLLKGILGSNYLAYPTSGMCKRAVRQLEKVLIIHFLSVIPLVSGFTIILSVLGAS
jgi:hypothetical protein